MNTTYTLSTIPARAGSALLKARPAKPVILADGSYYCDAPEDAGEAAELLAGLIADEAERIAATATRDAAAGAGAEPTVFSAAADEAIAAYGEMLLGRMIAMGASDTSDDEIERTLADCVCGPMLVALAKEMRARGLLVLDVSASLRHVLPEQWVFLIAHHDNCVITTPGGPDLLCWAASEPCSQEIIRTTTEADALCAQWPEHADALREIACQRIGMLAWG